MSPKKITLIRTPKSLSMMSLDEIAEREENNRLASAERRATELAFIQRCRDHYEFHPDSSLDKTKLVPVVLFNDSGRSLIIASLAAMRGHQSEALSAIRRAIEAVAFAHKAAHNEESARIWVQRKSKDTEYWKQFQGKNRFPKGVKEFAPLMAAWEQTSEAGSHSTFVSMALRTKLDGGRVGAAYFDLSDDPDTDVCRLLNFIVATHVRILGIFGTILEELLPSDWRGSFEKLANDRDDYANTRLRSLLQEAEHNPPKVEERTPAGIIIPRPGEIATLIFHRAQVTQRPKKSR